MSAALVRSVLRARAAVVRSTGATAAPLQVRWKSAAKKGGKRGDDDLYDPYKLYQEEHGKPGYREFNPDNIGDVDDFEWEEPKELMEDKSWPMTSGTDMFTDLLNVSGKPLPEEKMNAVLAELFRRINHTSIDQIQLPEMSVDVPAEHPDKDALEIMKLSLLNNGRITMDDKNEIMASIIDELNHLRKDQTKLFQHDDILEQE
ncbi:hypothetical protein P43SY_002712 [Pythium insidiosum]|uniref:Uncharacterized protein n=1 Tax=Pythium insidiosum TaxID=114742 RepID=A0AAD5QFM8_PYTIN|nr:hypothetical protein P43SY_002712 [Pythium insidiosum]